MRRGAKTDNFSAGRTANCPHCKKDFKRKKRKQKFCSRECSRAQKTGGRKTIMTDIVTGKLEEVFAIGGSDGEACFFAGISTQTLYDYQKKVPEFVDRKNSLKKKPVLKARTEVVKGLTNNPEFSLKYLERKRKKEFSLQNRIDHTTKGKPINKIEVIFKDYGVKPK